MDGNNIISSRSIPIINNASESGNKPKYPMNDMVSVYTHYNPKIGRNEPTENKLKEVSN